MKEVIIPTIEGKDMTETYLTFCLDLCEKGTLIDLGCGHGNHSKIARNKGFFVTGLDGRTIRMPVHESGICWRIGNVEDVDLSFFDTVLASGILYHLTLNAQLELFGKLKEANVKNLIINTHFAIFNKNTPKNKMFQNLLRARVEIQGGYSYSIYDERENYRDRVEASLNNDQSCWFDFDSLIRMIEEKAGFKDITIIKPLLCEDRCWLICKR